MLTPIGHVAQIFERIPFWALLVYDLLVLAVIALAIVRRRGFASTLAWIFAIIALPGAGVVAYLLLANPHVARTRRAKRRATLKVRQRRGRGASGAAGEGRLTPAERSVLRLAERLSDIAPEAGNRVSLASSNEEASLRVTEGIAAARRSIWAEYYMVKNDTTGRQFLDLLARRAREGLDVRFLYDAVGSWGIDAGALETLRKAGGHVEVFLPINPLRRRWAVHLRNHRKILVLDGAVAMTGGMNIGDEYSGHRGRRAVRAWRDTLLVLEGPAAGALAEVFAEDWSFATGTEEILDAPRQAEAESGGSLVSILPSGPDQEANAARLAYFAGITSAVSRCWIASPYFIPDGPTNRALVTAALRGVDVRILLPEKNDVTLMGPAGRSYYNALVKAGARIFEYRPAMLHSKSMSVDGRWCLIGSANVDVRSFWLNFEISALIFDTKFAAAVESQFERDLAQSREITPEILSARGVWAALGEGVARLMSPLL
ncbi:MAG TPA: cardiolipin synthase [Thermoanaerobaculia bacterium]|nr:cardiolipin synthase [Thermoanaerobaculia bacterium]